MRKTYAAPAVNIQGDVIRVTKNTAIPPEGSGGQGEAPGSVGFHL